MKSSPTQYKSERLRTVTHALSRESREKAWNVRVSVDANTGVDGVGRGPRCPANTNGISSEIPYRVADY